MAGHRGINAFARRAAHRVAGRLAAWAIAYVLVLQAVVTGFAAGAMPLGLDPELCIGASGAGAAGPAGDHDDAGGQHGHCQACLARADLPALPPPPPVPALVPLAGALRLDAGVPRALPRIAVPGAFRARAPPALA